LRNRILDVKQAAKWLSVSPDTVRRMADAETFPHAYSVGTRSRRYWRIPEDDLRVVRPPREPEGE
jgi:excisionase family DNA binding protein